MICWQFSPMRQLGACTGNRNSPKLTHGSVLRLAVRMKTDFSRGNSTSGRHRFAEILRLWKVILASNRRIAVWAAVVLAGSFFLMTSFRQGWLEVQSDFPNYYTAAVLTRHHMPLQRFYDWRWFQRQMNYTGTERQLGGYIPQTPLTMVPLLPLSGLAPQAAKQVWLAFNLILLGGSVALFSRMT